MSFDYAESFQKGLLIGALATFVSMMVGFSLGILNPLQDVMGLPLVVWSVVIGAVVGGIINVAMRS